MHSLCTFCEVHAVLPSGLLLYQFGALKAVGSVRAAEPCCNAERPIYPTGVPLNAANRWRSALKDGSEGTCGASEALGDGFGEIAHDCASELRLLTFHAR